MAGINLKYNRRLDALVLKPGRRDVVSYRLATRLSTPDVPELLHLWRSVPPRGLARSRSMLPAADLGAFLAERFGLTSCAPLAIGAMFTLANESFYLEQR